MPKNIPSDIWKRVDIKSKNDCWNWMGSLYPNGYEQISIDYKTCLVHRIAYKETYGKIPNDLIVCHTCNNPKCCNPNHLYLGTQRDNMRQCIEEERLNHVVGEKIGNIFRGDYYL